MPPMVGAAPSTAHLSPTQIAELRRLLLEEHVLQRARIVELQDPVDMEPDLAEVLLARCLDALDEIEAALAVIDRDGYGTCTTCGSVIPYERLEAVPATRHCVACQAGRDDRVGR